jgi:hypothetical protein
VAVGFVSAAIGHERSGPIIRPHLVPEDRTPRQNWGKFKAHKWGGFTGRLEINQAEELLVQSFGRECSFAQGCTELLVIRIFDEGTHAAKFSQRCGNADPGSFE